MQHLGGLFLLLSKEDCVVTNHGYNVTPFRKKGGFVCTGVP